MRTMTNHSTTISVRGRSVSVPSATVAGRTAVVTGRFLKIASIHDEAFVGGQRSLDVKTLVEGLSKGALRADLLTFTQRFDDKTPQHPYAFEWDNAAVAPTADFDAWWRSLTQVVRKNVRRAAKRGVTVEITSLNADLVRGIKALYDEQPIRQGRRFWHYGKDLETVRAENSSYLERSEFIAAYHEGSIIGFMKFVYVDDTAVIMQILSSSAHYDKRPMNALLAKAVEVCSKRGVAHLVYGKFIYGRKADSDIVDFKRRNGFVQLDFPRYYVPLSLKGRVAFALNLHHGAANLLPASVMSMLLGARAKVLDLRSGLRGGRAQSESDSDSVPAEG